MTKVIPAKISHIARVTINGFNLQTATKKPLMDPMARPNTAVAGMTSQGGNPKAFNIRHPTMEERPAAAPTERSIPPKSSTKVCPKATSPTNDASRITTVRLKDVRKFGEATARITHKTIRATNTPLASHLKIAFTISPGELDLASDFFSVGKVSSEATARSFFLVITLNKFLN